VKLNSVIYHTKNLAQIREFYESTFGLKVGAHEKDGKTVPDCSEKYVNFVLDGETLLCFEIDGGPSNWIKVKDPDCRSLIFEQERPNR
jgi:catechol 2,3-dioxygenase-like lactoylglutathione lyase family enzyme